MNLRWLRQNLLMIVAGLVFVGLLAIVIWFEHQAFAKKEEIAATLEDQQQQLTRLRDQTPTPSTNNIEAIKQEREQLQQLYQQLQSGAVRKPVEVPDLQSDIDFSQLMRKKVTGLRAEASGNGVKTVDNFAYGFSRYDTDFPCRQTATKPEDCKTLLALLAKQLLVVEKLGGLLIDSHVEEIIRIRRTEVEAGGVSQDELAVPIGNDPKALYQTYPFELEFSCDTKGLRAFLNSLTQSDWFFAVRSLKVDSTASTTTTSTPTPAAARGAEAETPVGAGRTIDRRLLHATIRVDLIELATAPAPPKT